MWIEPVSGATSGHLCFYVLQKCLTEFGAELRLKSPEAILFHKHSEAVVVSDVSVYTGKELSLRVKNSGRFVFAGAKLFCSQELQKEMHTLWMTR